MQLAFARFLLGFAQTQSETKEKVNKYIYSSSLLYNSFFVHTYSLDYTEIWILSISQYRVIQVKLLKVLSLQWEQVVWSWIQMLDFKKINYSIDIL